MAKYFVDVAGESHRNADGSSRQKEIARCRTGERVELLREPDNPYDTNAIFVISERGTGIGYIAADKAEWMAERMDKGRPISARINSINRPARANSAGVVLIVDTASQDYSDSDMPSGLIGLLARLFR